LTPKAVFVENKREQIIQILLESVRAGKYAADDKLPPERELAAEMGVSRVVLREAIVVLETLGVLDVRTRQGVYVKKPVMQNLAESLRFLPFLPTDFVPQLMEMRRIIDIPAARLAAERRTEVEMLRIEECFYQLESIALTDEDAIQRHAHYEFLFHRLLVEASHNSILARVYEALVSLMEKNNEILHQNLVQNLDWAPRVVEHHRRITAAVASKDPAAAAAAMQTHIGESTEKIMVQLSSGQLSYPIGSLRI
jgi:GntR family transcriptional repressor for pyruvate dehydrogenase complex